LKTAEPRKALNTRKRKGGRRNKLKTANHEWH
jgi:hypothetical protein